MPESGETVVPNFLPLPGATAPFVNGFNMRNGDVSPEQIFAFTVEQARFEPYPNPGNTVPRTVLVPDQLTYISRPGLMQTQIQREIKSATDFQQAYSVGVDASIESLVWSSACSSSLASSSSVFQSAGRSYFMNFAVQTAYSIRREPSSFDPTCVTPSFQERLAKLSPDSPQADFFRFFDVYGTHVLMDGTFGGYFVLTTSVETKAMSESTSRDLKSSLSGSFSGLVTSGRLSVSLMSSEAEKKEFSESNMQFDLDVVGGVYSSSTDAFFTSCFGAPVLLLGVAQEPKLIPRMMPIWDRRLLQPAGADPSELASRLKVMYLAYMKTPPNSEYSEGAGNEGINTEATSLFVPMAQPPINSSLRAETDLIAVTTTNLQEGKDVPNSIAVFTDASTATTQSLVAENDANKVSASAVHPILSLSSCTLPVRRGDYYVGSDNTGRPSESSRCARQHIAALAVPAVDGLGNSIFGDWFNVPTDEVVGRTANDALPSPTPPENARPIDLPESDGFLICNVDVSEHPDGVRGFVQAWDTSSPHATTVRGAASVHKQKILQQSFCIPVTAGHTMTLAATTTWGPGIDYDVRFLPLKGGVTFGDFGRLRPGTAYAATTDGFAIMVLNARTKDSICSARISSGTSPSDAMQAKEKAATSIHQSADIWAPTNTVSLPIQEGEAFFLQYSITSGSCDVLAYWIPLTVDLETLRSVGTDGRPEDAESLFRPVPVLRSPARLRPWT